MRRPVLALLAATSLTVLGCALAESGTPAERLVTEMVQDESPAPGSFSLVVLHPRHGDLVDLLAAHAERAAALDRRPYVEFSATWCPSCLRLEGSLEDDRMIEAFEGTYIIRLDLDEWKARLTQTSFVVFGVPAFFELDGDGRPNGRTITGAAWGEDIPENMAPVLKEFFEG